MKPKIIKSDLEYRSALAYLHSLMAAAPGSPEEEQLELVSILIEKYENEHFPIDLPDPIEAIKFSMEQQGLARKDLVPYIGSQSKVSEVLNGKRPLSLSMIRALEKGLGIPSEVLLQEPGKKPQAPDYGLRPHSLTRPAVLGTSHLISEAPSTGYASKAGKPGKAVKSNSQPRQPAPVTNYAQTFERLCLAVGLDIPEGENNETVFANWYRAETKQVFDLYQAGEINAALGNLFFLERTLRTHAQNSPFLFTLADLLLQMRLFMNQKIVVTLKA
jgi:HTH-type transcriptional regulator/antitoxin HigA